MLSNLQRTTNTFSLKKLKEFTGYRDSNAVLKRNFSLDNYRIKRDHDDLPELKNVLCTFINNNKKYFNQEVIKIPEFDKKTSIQIDSVRFVEKVLPGQ